MTTPVSTTSLPLRPGSWALDHNHSGVSFVVRHLGLTNVRGRFDRFDAHLDIGSSLDDLTVSAEVELSSVDTNNADRDAHLRTSDFFDTERHQVMTFLSKSVIGAGDRYELAGDLTLNGITKPVVFDVEFNGTEVFPGDQTTRAGFTATGEIRRSEFGIDFGIVLGEKIMLGDKIKIELDLQFVAP